METRVAYNYDDFDKTKLEGENSGAGLFSPFTFICVTLFISLYGLLSLYSATFDLAVRNNLPHYYYLATQIQGALLGLVLGLLARLLPLKLIRRSYYFFVPLAIAVLVLMLNPEFNKDGVLYIKGIRIISGANLAIFASIILVSGTNASIKKLDERHGIFYGIVIIFVAALAYLTVRTSGLGYYFLLVLVVVSMLHASGASRGYCLISFLFFFVTGIYILLCNSDILKSVIFSSLPVADSAMYDHQLFISQMAIKDGSFWGIGLGHGLYKLGLLEGIESKFIFSSISEETGLIGVIVLFLLLFAFAVLGIRASQRAEKKSSYAIAGASMGIGMFVFISAAMNALYASGIIPFSGITFPFFSFGPGEEALFIFMSVVQYRFIRLMGRPNEKA